MWFKEVVVAGFLVLVVVCVLWKECCGVRGIFCVMFDWRIGRIMYVSCRVLWYLYGSFGLVESVEVGCMCVLCGCV